MTAIIITTESFAEIETAFESFPNRLTGAAIVYGHGAFQFDIGPLARAAARHGVVVMGDERSDAEAGCLMSYSTRHAGQARTFAAYVDRILRGEHPAAMAFALPENSELVINRATADLLGVALPAAFVQRADVVIN